MIIKITKNPNFTQWFQVIFTDALGFWDIIDEVKGRAGAMRIAKKLAQKEKIKNVDVEGFIISTEEL
jgi:hypothetical protein|tara:strand:- start:1355 stop:1555 length:201 start_codon:yes stop_codon:yes gene_type:complete